MIMNWKIRIEMDSDDCPFRDKWAGYCEMEGNIEGDCTGENCPIRSKTKIKKE